MYWYGAKLVNYSFDSAYRYVHIASIAIELFSMPYCFACMDSDFEQRCFKIVCILYERNSRRSILPLFEFEAKSEILSRWIKQKRRTLSCHGDALMSVLTFI